jgi:hypothetical protein
VIWVYAICDYPDVPPPAPLEGVREGALLAVVSRHERRVVEPAPDLLWAHERVVERLMADRTVLPMRFGSTVEDEDELRTLLADRQESFLRLLGRLEGLVEVGVRAIADGSGAHEPPPTTGRDYLLSRLRDDQRMQSLDEPLAALATDARRQAAHNADDVLRAAYLVDRRDVPRFRTCVEELQREHPDVAILCTGPWPPYSFVSP